MLNFGILELQEGDNLEAQFCSSLWQDEKLL
jgi:hypothetical protein